MRQLPIGAIPIPAFVVEGCVIVDANAPADALFPAVGLSGRQWGECFFPSDDHYSQRCDDATGRWFRLDEHADGATRVILATDVTDELHARAILEGLFADCFVLDRDARLAWKLTPRRRAASSWSVDSHPIDQLHPDDLTPALDQFASALETPGLRDSSSLRVKHPARPGYWEHVTLDTVSGVADPWLNGVVICSRVDDAADTQPGLVDSPFYSLAEAAPTGIVVVDERDRPAYLNELARELLGIAHDAPATAWIEAFAPDDRPVVATALTAARLDDRRTRHLARIETATASAWVRVEAVPQRGSAGTVGAIVTLVDVTDLIEARADIDRLVDALQAGSDLVLVVEPDLRITHVKGSGHEHFAALEAAAVADLRDIVAFDRDGEVDRLRDALEHVLGGQSWRGEMGLVIGDVTVPVSVLCVPRHDADGVVESFAFVARDISDLKQTQQRLAHLAMHDPLTGLANRLGLRDELDRELARWRRGELHGLALAFVDLDDFKQINDEFGHEAGDHVLRDVASRMQRIVRGNDVLARIGGDEFVAIIGLDSANQSSLDQLAARFSEVFGGTPMLIGGRAVPLRASVGVVTAQGLGEDAAALLARADAAMYQAKRAGKNQVRVA